MKASGEHGEPVKCADLSQSECGAISDLMRRADGRCLCPDCGQEYYRHPYCSNSRFEDGAGFVCYYLHVLCDGSHVKL